MTLQECYAVIGGDYDAVIGRLRSERMVQKFVLKFLDDGSYDLLRSSLAAENYKEAFRAVHTLKGVCQNLSLNKLEESSSKLTEALREGWSADAAGLVEQVCEDYQQTVEGIQAFQASLDS